jgi:hypothetical protein
MSRRAERVAENEALFRSVNERVTDIVAELGEATTSVEIFCECGDARCEDRLTIARSRYEAVRENPRRFLVTVGHVAPDIEVVVEETGTFDIVEKVGEAAEVAEATDSRSD